jgi:Aminotransferase class-V
MHCMTPLLDLSFVRSHFPALSGADVFLDNGGGTQVLGEVIARAADYMTMTNVQPVRSLGGRAADGANRLLGARRRLAAWVNAESDGEIVSIALSDSGEPISMLHYTFTPALAALTSCLWSKRFCRSLSSTFTSVSQPTQTPRRR